jgi:hypothetical protein
MKCFVFKLKIWRHIDAGTTCALMYLLYVFHKIF